MYAKIRIGAWTMILGGALAVQAAAADVKELLKAAQSGDVRDRVAAIDELGVVGTKSPESVATLTQLLKDASPEVRAHAAQSLGEIGKPALPAVPSLVGAVADDEAIVRREAIDALRKLRPGPKVTVPLMAKVLSGSDDAARIRAVAALAEAGKDAVPALVEALNHEQARYWACLVISEIGPDAKEAVPALVKTLSDEMPDVRREAILALAAIGKGASPAVPQLVAALESRTDRVPATYALGMIGQVPDAAVAKIRENAKAEDFRVSTVSHWALAKLNPTDQEEVRAAVSRLAAALKNKDAQVREAAARALADLDPDPKTLRPILQEALAGVDAETLSTVMDAFAGLGQRILPRLIEALKDPQVRGRAAAIIGRIGPPAKEAVPALIATLEDKNSQTRAEVLFALAAIGPDAKAAVPAIVQSIQDQDINVRYGACYALGKIGPAAVTAKPELTENLTQADQFLAMTSAWALAQIDPQCSVTAPKSVPVLVKALAEPEPMVRIHAAESLGRLGPLAKQAVPALKQTALEDENADVRAAADTAIRAIAK